jgi:hypothetical protein
MGTNYYLYEKQNEPCPTCGHCDEAEPLHIGKSSAGWCFSLHVIPERGINDLEDWEALWSRPGCVIKNEYGETLTPDEMKLCITERGRIGLASSVPYGYRSWHEFYTSNQAKLGPNGLVRHVVGRHCLKHGEGTWDCITGEFS